MDISLFGTVTGILFILWSFGFLSVLEEIDLRKAVNNWLWVGILPLSMLAVMVGSVMQDRMYYVVRTFEVRTVDNIDVIIDTDKEIINLNERFKRDFQEGEVIYDIKEHPSYPLYSTGRWKVTKENKKEYIKEL